MHDVEAYLAHLAAERRLSAHTVAAYRRDLDALARLAAGKALRDLDTADIRSAIVRLRSRNLSAPSLARQISAWRGFFGFACRRLGYPRDPTTGVRPPKAARRLPEPLSVDAMAQLLDRAPADALEHRDRAMFELLYSSGLRLAELAAAGIGDLDLASGEIRVTGKGGKTRIVPVGSKASDALRAWLRQRPAAPGEPALFVSRHGTRLTPRSIQSRLARWARLAGIAQRVHPHKLRHAFASHLLQSSADLRAVQELLGHASISTTQVYTHLDWQHLARVYDEAHPRARKKS